MDHEAPGDQRNVIKSRIAALSPEKRALLASRLGVSSLSAPGREQIPRRSAGELPVAPSYAQERVWFLEQWEEGASPVYNIARAWWLQGPLMAGRLQEAFERLAARHESLRTVFASERGEPRQRVLTRVELALPVIDLGGLPAADARRDALRRARALAEAPFELERAPLLRPSLFRIAAESHLLALVMHHIIADGWSLGVLLRELGALYDGPSADLPPLPLQYPDYALWQRAWLQGAEIERQLAYWRGRLAGLGVLDLPTDRPRPPKLSHRGRRHELAFTPALTAALKRLSGCEGATLYMVLLAAFQVLLARYSGQRDIAVGSPIAGRNRRELEGLIGMFVNTLVMRTDVSGNPGFRELLGRVRESALAAYAHQDLPFEKLVEELEPARDLSRSPLFQVMFALQTMPAEALALQGLEVRAQDLDTGTAKFDLTLTLYDRPEGLAGHLEYAADLFEAATVARLAGHLETVLEGIVARPELPVSELPLLRESERRQILVEWNRSGTDYPRDACVSRLFEQQAERAPDAAAVVDDDTELSYRQLNARANQLARHLRDLGVGPGVAVGLCVERSVEMVVGMLGILKAGGAYVPLDPEYPPQRLAFMLADSRVRVLLTEQRLAQGLPDHEAAIVCLDAPARDAAAARDLQNPASGATAESVAYVMYTSGSTGKPKGVLVPHRAISRLVVATDYVQLGPADVVAQISNCSFDAATFEIWGALLNGARLVVIGKDVVLSPVAFAAAVERCGINTLFVTTALFNTLAETAPAVFGKLRHLLFGGEAVDPRWVRKALVEAPPERLLHVYGPTEATTFASWHLVTAVPADARTVPIGRPIANTELYVLDETLQPVPVLVAGELYIGGPGVALGYLDRPALTAEKFVGDPFTDRDGGVLFKTGDMARYLPDGNIEFLRRRDDQVKLRGYRIELGEIEALLGQHPAVSKAAVLMREDAPGDKRLVAYVVTQTGASGTDGDLRAFLRTRLPDYMVPSVYRFLDVLPLAPNGKVDRNALPAPGGARSGAAPAYAAPRTAVERVLAAIWAELLGLERVGIDDNFFDLGGHSLLATRVTNRLYDTFGLSVPLKRLFEFPTVKRLAATLETMQWAAAGPPAIAAAPPGAEDTGEI